MSDTEKPKRVRRRSIDLQIQQALNAAQELDGAPHDELSVSKMKLVQTRLTILARMQARREVGDLKRLKDALAKATSEVERLTRQHDVDVAELARLGAVCRTDTVNSFDDIASRSTQMTGG
jgi:hypothetical protein